MTVIQEPFDFENSRQNKKFVKQWPLFVFIVSVIVKG